MTVDFLLAAVEFNYLITATVLDFKLSLVITGVITIDLHTCYGF